jgi:nicotinate phosphoribosyltransferase
VPASSSKRRSRLDPAVFDLPVEKLRSGYYTDAYFNHARSALLADGRRADVLMQVFQKRHAYLGGMDEALAILRLCSHDWPGLEVRALHDGDAIEPYETVLTIAGEYTSFAHLETVYLGTLARRTLITTNVVRVLEAANGKPIIFMPARHDHYRVQTGDGYAAYVAGEIAGRPIGVTTDDQASWWGGRAVGTVPHALIAAYGGDTVLVGPPLRRVGARGHEHHRPRRLRERLGGDGARGRPRARAAALGGAARHLGDARRPLALGRAR